MPGSIRGVEMNRTVRLYPWLAAALLLLLAAASTLAHGQAAGDIQVFRNAQETLYVFPPSRTGGPEGRAGPCGIKSWTEQSETGTGGLRLLASRIGVSPAHFVTVTVYGADNSLRESLEKSAREVFSDWGPASAFVEAKNLRPPGAQWWKSKRLP